MDGLQYVETESSMRLMFEMMLNNKVSDYRSEEWSSTISQYKNPTKSNLKQAYDLLKANFEKPNIILAVTSLAESYCMRNLENCREDTENLVEFLENKIIHAYKDEPARKNYKENQNVMLMYLKGLSNIALFKYRLVDEQSSTFWSTDKQISGKRSYYIKKVGDYQKTIKDTLMEMLEDKELAPSVRIGVMEVFFEEPFFNHYALQHVKNLFTDTNENLEVRIASYNNIFDYCLINRQMRSKTLEKCFGKILPLVYKILHDEDANQCKFIYYFYIFKKMS